MDIQLKELIETIKSEGIKSGEEQGAQLLEKAKIEALKIINDANKEADKIRAKAKDDAVKEIASGEAAIKQASRDLILNLRQEIETIFTKLIQKEVKTGLTKELLKDAVVAVVKGLTEDCSNLKLMVDKKQLSAIEKSLTSLLSNEIKKGLEIVPFEQIDAGFRVSYKDGSGFFDFSDKEIALILSGYLNQKLASIITQD